MLVLGYVNFQKACARRKGGRWRFPSYPFLVVKAVLKFVPFHGAAVRGFLFEADGSANRVLSPFHGVFLPYRLRHIFYLQDGLGVMNEGWPQLEGISPEQKNVRGRKQQETLRLAVLGWAE